MTPPARLSKPVNKLVNEAVGEYVQSRTAELEANSTGMLDRIKAVGAQPQASSKHSRSLPTRKPATALRRGDARA